ncbi:MAG: MMPL family transporter [Candidatus Brocadiia bacterium]
MPEPPATQEAALEVRRKAMRIPFLNGTMVSEDGKAVCIYLPLTSKDQSYKVYKKLQEKVATFTGPEEFHITGLPVAEDTFGMEMFKQMAISAPIAMIIIFILLLVFFRNLLLIVSPMIVAIVAAASTMALLVVTGNTVHIMSSMIPIFIVPIAVLDAVHILSEFFDRYQETRDRRQTIQNVMDKLFIPMLYTSLTTAVGFASLALAPIPPVQVFGLFVAFGVMVAWFCTVNFIPSFIMFIPEERLENFGASHSETEATRTVLGNILRNVGQFTYRYAKLILVLVVILLGVSVYGIKLIRINDNPTKWFGTSHPIRVADRVLNDHFGGTYMAYLSLRPPGKIQTDASQKSAAEKAGTDETTKPEPAPTSEPESDEPSLPSGLESPGVLPAGGGMSTGTEPALPSGLGGGPAEGSQDDSEPSAAETREEEIFKNPKALAYIAGLQKATRKALPNRIGKSNSLADIVKTVHRDLMTGVVRNGDKLTPEQAFRLPDTVSGVGDCLFQYQSSHRPEDLWHFVTPDYRESVMWFQITSGDNKDMSTVKQTVDNYIDNHPPPFELKHDWFGLTYINVVWQHKMAWGMLKAFLGSFLCVFLMMTLLYRSALWGLLCMVPLTVTIGMIYGIVGLVGKDYDMPVAVLSSLSLGLAVDYAIHFLTRSRDIYQQYASWEETAEPVFGEPARAITRNAIVVGLGFLPLLAAPLVPYQTVGIFIAAILFTAGVASLLILPSLITLLEKKLFPRSKVWCITCNCITCITSGIAGIALVIINVEQLLDVGWSLLTGISIPVILILAGICAYASRHEKRRTKKFVAEGENQ